MKRRIETYSDAWYIIGRMRVFWRKEHEGKIIRSRSWTGRSGTYDI